jgi:hypothetical protein
LIFVRHFYCGVRPLIRPIREFRLLTITRIAKNTSAPYPLP